jgi:hypothetical protein
MDGMISWVTLVPELKLGLVVLSNSINRLPAALAYRILDHYMGLETRDWSSIYLKHYQESEKRDMRKAKDIQLRDPAGVRNQLKLKDYAGIYSDPKYGKAEVNLEKGKLVLRLLPAPVFVSDLTHLHYDTFLLKLRNTLSFVPHSTGTVQFIRNSRGTVVEMKVDIPNHDLWFDELEFRKK